MPTPWLVTSPPTPSRPASPAPCRTAKRCSQGLRLWPQSLSRLTTPRENENRCDLAQPQRFPENRTNYLTSSVKSVFAPSAVTSISCSTPVGAGFAMQRHDLVFARRHVLDRERAILAGHGEVRMIHDGDVGEHPRMHVALEPEEVLRLGQSENSNPPRRQTGPCSPPCCRRRSAGVGERCAWSGRNS